MSANACRSQCSSQHSNDKGVIMIRVRSIALLVALCLLLLQAIAEAGMPAVLPTGWTAGSRTAPEGAEYGPSQAAPYLQAISFFIVVLLGCAWAVKGLWGVLRREWTALPELTYWRSLSLVVLWGLLFVVVLTMISGARELMTPGAWQKQGWTYRLAKATPPAGDNESERRRGLERLRQALWQFAALHEGKFPAADDTLLEDDAWQLPGWPGLRYMYVSGRQAEEAGRLLVFEPSVGESRQVLLTNGVIGTLTTAEIEAAVSKAKQP